MQTASRLNLLTGQIDEYVQARDHRQFIERTGALNDDFVFFVPHDGEPLEYAQGQKNVSHFKRVAGYGLESPLKGSLRAKAEKPFADRQGPKQLLILEDRVDDKHVFTYKGRYYDFEQATNFRKLPAESGLYSLDQWVLGNKGNFAASVAHSIDETVRVIRDARTMMAQPGQLSRNFFIAYRGVVSDYNHFFLDRAPKIPYIKNPTPEQLDYLRRVRPTLGQTQERQDERRMQFAQMLHENKIGITVRKDEDDPKVKTDNRVISTPVLARLHLTDKAIGRDGAKSLTCNYVETGKQTDMVVLLNTFPDSLRETQAFDRVVDHMVKGGDILVLGSASMEYDEKRLAVERQSKRQQSWGALNFVVNDVERQVRLLNDPMPPGR